MPGIDPRKGDSLDFGLIISRWLALSQACDGSTAAEQAPNNLEVTRSIRGHTQWQDAEFGHQTSDVAAARRWVVAAPTLQLRPDQEVARFSCGTVVELLLPNHKLTGSFPVGC